MSETISNISAGVLWFSGFTLALIVVLLLLLSLRYYAGKRIFKDLK